jgi:flagellar motor switch/type III secretory pathway protein FliN
MSTSISNHKKRQTSRNNKRSGAGKQIERITPKQFHRSELEWNNKLSTCSSTLKLQHGDTPFTFKIGLPNETKESRNMHCIKLLVRDHSIWITINHWPKSLTKTNPDIFRLTHSSSAAIKKMAIELLLSPMISWIEHATGLSVRVADYSKGHPKPHNHMVFSFFYKEDGANRRDGNIVISSGLKGIFFNLLERWPAPETMHINNRLGVSTRLTIGSTILTTAELNDVDIGDIIFLDQNIYSEGHRMWALFSPNILITLRQETQTMADSDLANNATADPLANPSNNIAELMVETIAESAIPDHSHNDSPSANGEVSDQPFIQNPLVENLQIKLDFDLGSVSLTLAQIKQLRPGHMFSMGRPLGKSVYISSNGQRLARGELIDIDGIVGVRVQKLYKANHG